jgi:gamma-glutamyl-gamma-aminobutyrate hydrolase PuuD
MPRPVIGITMDYGEKPTQYMLPDDYATAVEKAGGMPYCIPFRLDLSLIPELVDLFDGISVAVRRNTPSAGQSARYGSRAV